MAIRVYAPPPRERGNLKGFSLFSIRAPGLCLRALADGHAGHRARVVLAGRIDSSRAPLFVSY